MFDANKNENSRISPEKLNLSEEKNLKIEDFPVYTMKEDLENANNPHYVASAFNTLPQKSSPSIQPQPNETLPAAPEKQKNSPFLAPDKIAANPIEQPAKTTPEITPKTASPLNWGKVLIIAIITFIILLSGAGGYYYWINIKNSGNLTQNATTAENPKENGPETTPTQPEETPIITNEPSFSSEKPNYFVIDTINFDLEKIKSTITDYSKKIIETNTVAPLEFQLVDEKNNPIAFSDFSGKIGLKIPLAIAQNLDNNFSLFINNDNGTTRLGMVINSKDDAKLKNSILSEESNLLDDFQSFYALSGTAPSPNKIKLNSSVYKEAQIKYYNIPSADNLSFDYSVYKGKLIIGLSKMTERSIIDYVSSHSASQNQ